jgi:hypothetical protein
LGGHSSQMLQYQSTQWTQTSHIINFFKFLAYYCYLAFQSLDSEHTWRRLFKKCVCTLK